MVDSLDAGGLRAIARAVTLPLWRAVEAQHIAATRVLVDSLAEQALLEQLLEDAKPAVPMACARLDYLLFTPFRYPTRRAGSRFRARSDPGVWYGAEQPRTACAEIGYWRCRFVADSAGLDRLEAVPHTVFRATAKGLAVDLRQPPLSRHAVRWTAPDDYGPCQDFARDLRGTGVEAIRYASVRDPQNGGCAAVLDCRAFVGTRGISQRQTWFLSVDADRASWVRSGARVAATEAFEFDYRDGSPAPAKKAGLASGLGSVGRRFRTST